MCFSGTGEEVGCDSIIYGIGDEVFGTTGSLWVLMLNMSVLGLPAVL